ncbi:MAG: tyrosine-type recombinase/integrase [Desulfurococcaceae archaeon]
MGNPYHVFQYLSSKTTPERPRIICGMLFFMGLRLGELLLLEKKDLDLIGKTALIYTLKQRKAIKNAIPLDHVPASELKLWNAYMMTVAGERIFQDVSRRTVERIVVRELDMNPHALRHALGLFLYEYTKDIRVVSQVLRHKNISNTFIYTKLSLQGVREKIKI